MKLKLLLPILFISFILMDCSTIQPFQEEGEIKRVDVFYVPWNNLYREGVNLGNIHLMKDLVKTSISDKEKLIAINDELKQLKIINNKICPYESDIRVVFSIYFDEIQEERPIEFEITRNKMIIQDHTGYEKSVKLMELLGIPLE